MTVVDSRKSGAPNYSSDVSILVVVDDGRRRDEMAAERLEFIGFNPCCCG